MTGPAGYGPNVRNAENFPKILGILAIRAVTLE
jgi:hypothetical protein